VDATVLIFQYLDAVNVVQFGTVHPVGPGWVGEASSRNSATKESRMLLLSRSVTAVILLGLSKERGVFLETSFSE